MSATMHRWSLVDGKGKTRGTCEAREAEEAVFFIRGPRKPLPAGWKVVDRGPVVRRKPKPEAAKKSETTSFKVAVKVADLEEVKDRLAQAAALNEALAAERDALRKEVQEGIARIAEQGETIGIITAERNEAIEECNAAEHELKEARAARHHVLNDLYVDFKPERETWAWMIRGAAENMKLVRRHREALGLAPRFADDGLTISGAIQRLKDERDAAIKERDAAVAARDDAERELGETKMELLGAMDSLCGCRERLDDVGALHRAIDLTEAEGDGWRMLHAAMGNVLER